MKALFYVAVYGFLGFALERVINLLVYGTWVDNRVLYLFWQPMYGVGVVLTVGVYGVIKKKVKTLPIRLVFLIPFAILATALAEHVSGTVHEQLFDRVLWDYRHTFEFCSGPYTCSVPTGLFGVLSALTVVFVHPFIKRFTGFLPEFIIYGVNGLLVIDYILTYSEVLR